MSKSKVITLRVDPNEFENLRDMVVDSIEKEDFLKSAARAICTDSFILNLALGALKEKLEKEIL